MFLFSGAIALQICTLVLVNAQKNVPATPENFDRRCRFAPCPESYIEMGVVNVTQLAISGGEEEAGVVCCDYDKFPIAVDPPRCCYNANSRGLVRGRFSCPLQGIPKPAGCDASSTTTSTPTPTPTTSSTSASSTPSGVTRAECENTFNTFKDVCSAISLLGNIAGLPCPSGSITDLINAVFTQILFLLQINSGDPREEVDKTFFANTFFATIGIGLGIGALIAGGPILVPIIASIVESLTALCTLASRLQFAGSLCSAGAIVLEVAECAGLPNKRRSITGDSSYPSIDTADESEPSHKKHPSVNVCSDLLAFFPSPSQCATALSVPSLNCTNLAARRLVDAGASSSEANTFITDCEAVEADRKNLVKLCKIRDALEDLVPFCDSDSTPGANPTNTQPSTIITVPCDGSNGCGHYPPANVDAIVVKPCNDPEKCDKNLPAGNEDSYIVDHCNGAYDCDKHPVNPGNSHGTEVITKSSSGPAAPYKPSKTSIGAPGETDFVLFTSGAWELGLMQLGHLVCTFVVMGILFM